MIGPGAAGTVWCREPHQQRPLQLLGLADADALAVEEGAAAAGRAVGAGHPCAGPAAVHRSHPRFSAQEMGMAQHPATGRQRERAMHNLAGMRLLCRSAIAVCTAMGQKSALRAAFCAIAHKEHQTRT